MSTTLVRSTKVRRALEEIFRCNPTPLSIANLFQQIILRHPDTAYSTVYRMVGRLEKEGTIVSIDWRERGQHYEWAGLPHHHHIICQKCSEVLDLDCQLFQFCEEDITQATGYRIHRHSIELEGICPNCQTTRQ